jgi:hypothetical protein
MPHLGLGTAVRVTSSGAFTKTTLGTVWSITVEATASAGTVHVHDGGAGGTLLVSHITPAAAGEVYTIDFPAGVRCKSGITVEVTNCAVILNYT